ncbi:MAG: hypothetical protein CMK59_05325 [Proteobacteria bacterium]|nr:hypothetical protein [Pseudomonadota bacterium]
MGGSDVEFKVIYGSCIVPSDEIFEKILGEDLDLDVLWSHPIVSKCIHVCEDQRVDGCLNFADYVFGIQIDISESSSYAVTFELNCVQKKDELQMQLEEYARYLEEHYLLKVSTTTPRLYCGVSLS